MGLQRRMALSTIDACRTVLTEEGCYTSVTGRVANL